MGNDSIEAVVDAAVKAGNLSKVGAGAVFTINCDEAIASSRFPSNLPTDEFGELNISSSGDMEAICCICEKGIADDIAQAALHNGAPGPTVTFGEGGGVRDKIPLLELQKVQKRNLFGVLSINLTQMMFLPRWLVLEELLNQEEVLCTLFLLRVV